MGECGECGRHRAVLSPSLLLRNAPQLGGGAVKHAYIIVVQGGWVWFSTEGRCVEGTNKGSRRCPREGSRDEKKSWLVSW